MKLVKKLIIKSKYLNSLQPSVLLKYKNTNHAILKEFSSTENTSDPNFQFEFLNLPSNNLNLSDQSKFNYIIRLRSKTLEQSDALSAEEEETVNKLKELFWKDIAEEFTCKMKVLQQNTEENYRILRKILFEILDSRLENRAVKAYFTELTDSNYNLVEIAAKKYKNDFKIAAAAIRYHQMLFKMRGVLFLKKPNILEEIVKKNIILFNFLEMGIIHHFFSINNNKEMAKALESSILFNLNNVNVLKSDSYLSRCLLKFDSSKIYSNEFLLTINKNLAANIDTLTGENMISSFGLDKYTFRNAHIINTPSDFVNYLIVLKGILEKITRKNDYTIVYKCIVIVNLLKSVNKLEKKIYSQTTLEIENVLESFYAIMYKVLTILLNNRDFDELINILSQYRYAKRGFKNTEAQEAVNVFEESIIEQFNQYSLIENIQLMDELNPKRINLVNENEKVCNIKFQKLMIDCLLYFDKMKQEGDSHNQDKTNEMYVQFKQTLDNGFKLASRKKLSIDSHEILNICTNQQKLIRI